MRIIDPLLEITAEYHPRSPLTLVIAYRHPSIAAREKPWDPFADSEAIKALGLMPKWFAYASNMLGSNDLIEVCRELAGGLADEITRKHGMPVVSFRFERAGFRCEHVRPSPLFEDPDPSMIVRDLNTGDSIFVAVAVRDAKGNEAYVNGSHWYLLRRKDLEQFYFWAD